jgi:hypothetical protein
MSKPETPELRQAKELSENLVRIGAELDKETRLLRLAERWRFLALQKSKGGPYQGIAAAMLAVCAKELEAMLRQK